MCPAHATLPVHVVPMGPHNPMAAAVCLHSWRKSELKAKYLCQDPAGRVQGLQMQTLAPPVSSSLTRDTNDTAINLLADRKALLQRKQLPRSPASGQQSGPWIQVSVCAQQEAPSEGSPRKCHRRGGLQGPGALCMHGGRGESERRRSHTTAAGVGGVRAGTAGS